MTDQNSSNFDHGNKKTRRRKKSKKLKNNLELADIQPLTDTQRQAYDAFDKGQNLVLHGYAGTGKTFIALHLMLEDLLVYDKTKEKVIVARSAVPTRSVGFLKGSLAQKLEAYEIPYKHHCQILFNRADAYDLLKREKRIEFLSTSYIRGMDIRNANIIVDEISNMTFHELDSIITRLGENCRIIFCGDIAQSDLKNNGLYPFLKILHILKKFDILEFQIDDIVRSGLVKDYIIAREKIHNDRTETIPAT